MNIIEGKFTKKLLRFSHSLKNYLKEKEEDKKIFSYQLEKKQFFTGEIVTIQQKGTGFSLSLLFERNQKHWMVKRFTLEDNKYLGYQSLSLYDAAAVEIVLQGLDLIFFLADYEKKQEIQFILRQEEFNHLDSFDSFFHSIFFARHQASFILPTSREDYHIFTQQAQRIHTKIRSALWVRQKEDIFLRDYLQHSNKDELFLPNNCQSENEQSFYRDNIVAFTSRSKVTVSEKLL